jgi:hypothetical protein
MRNAGNTESGWDFGSRPVENDGRSAMTSDDARPMAARAEAAVSTADPHATVTAFRTRTGRLLSVRENPADTKSRGRTGRPQLRLVDGGTAEVSEKAWSLGPARSWNASPSFGLHVGIAAALGTAVLLLIEIGGLHADRWLSIL